MKNDKPLRILVIIPLMNKNYMTNAESYIHIQKKYNAKILMICSGLRKGKGTGVDLACENMDGIEVHRIFKTFKEQTSKFRKKFDKIRKLVANFNPDIIICSQQSNMPLAVKIKKDFNIPIILLMEFAYNPKRPLKIIGKENILKVNSLGIFLESFIGCGYVIIPRPSSPVIMKIKRILNI